MGDWPLVKFWSQKLKGKCNACSYNTDCNAQTGEILKNPPFDIVLPTGFHFNTFTRHIKLDLCKHMFIMMSSLKYTANLVHG